MKVKIELPFVGEHPKWLESIEITREGDEILIQVVKTNGYLYAEAKMSTVEFNNAADMLLANP